MISAMGDLGRNANGSTQKTIMTDSKKLFVERFAVFKVEESLEASFTGQKLDGNEKSKTLLVLKIEPRISQNISASLYRLLHVFDHVNRVNL